MNLILEREIFSPVFTLGRLHAMGRELGFTCEDSVRGDGDPATVHEWKQDKITAIPYGRYEIKITFSNTFQKYLPLIMGVPGFTGIRFHGGNTAANSSGCVLLGLSRTRDGVKNCAPAVAELMRLLEEAADRREECYISVVRA